MRDPALTLVHISDFVNPAHQPIQDMRRYASMMLNMPDVIKVKSHHTVWNWLSEWHPYMFERNEERWPDGRFYLVDREYQPWRRHKVSFSGKELTEVEGLTKWSMRREMPEFDANGLMLVSDSTVWKLSRRDTQRKYAHMICALCRAMEAQYEAAKAKQ